MTAAAAALEPEDEARAALYGLIARLFYAAPDEGVIGQLLHARAFEAGDDALAQAWRGMVQAARSAYPVMLENEHTELFVGVGKAEVTPYLGHYVIEYATDSPLVELRQQLAQWGIARHAGTSEPEDHIAGVCEAMRIGIAVQHRTLDEQRQFFERFLYRGATVFCDAVTASPKAAFYRSVAIFAKAYLEVEKAAFEMA